MPTAAQAEYRAIIYLRGTQDEQLNRAEQRCRNYAGRFGWHVLESIRDHGDHTSLSQLLPRISRLETQIILTDTLDMISPDQGTRDDLMMLIERSECIVHPVTTPASPDLMSPAARET
jgi:DNA invertase Pin-like site-specific DNA recombinase